MTLTPEELNEAVDRIVAHAEERGHLKSFNKAKSGEPLNINSPEELKAHILETLDKADTRGFVGSDDGRKVTFYNEGTNTFISIDPNNPNGGSAYRPKTPAQGLRSFEKQPGETLSRNYTSALPNVADGGLNGVTAEWAERFPNQAGAAQDISRAMSDPNILGFSYDGNERLKPPLDGQPAEGSRYFFSERERAVIGITAEGTTIEKFDTLEEAQHAFGAKMQEAAEAFPDFHGRAGGIPDVFKGGVSGLSSALSEINGGGIGRKISNFAGDAAEFLGNASKVLGVIGGIAITAEVADLNSKASEMVKYGLVSEDAMLEYDTLLAGHIAQATLDPTLLAGELATQAWFDDWASRNGISDEVKMELEPGSLLEDIQAGLEVANEAIKAVAIEALQKAGYAAGAITDAVLQEKMENVAQDLLNSGPDGLRHFVEQNSDTISRQLQPSDLGHFNNLFEGLNLSPMTPPEIDNGSFFDWPNLIPEIQIPNIIPELRMPSIPNILPDLRVDINSQNEPSTRLAHFNDQSQPVTATLHAVTSNELEIIPADSLEVLREQTLETLPNDQIQIAELPESMQTMALVKDDPELFESEFNLFIEENGTDPIESFVEQVKAEESLVQPDLNYTVQATDYTGFDSTDQARPMTL